MYFLFVLRIKYSPSPKKIKKLSDYRKCFNPLSVNFEKKILKDFLKDNIFFV